MKNIIIKRRQDENAQLKDTIANLQHKVIILETGTNSVMQYDRINNIEITGIPENIGDKNLEHSIIEVFKAAVIQTSHNDIEDYRCIEKFKSNSKKTIVRLVNQNFVSRSYIIGRKSKMLMDQELICQISKYLWTKT